MYKFCVFCGFCGSKQFEVTDNNNEGWRFGLKRVSGWVMVAAALAGMLKSGELMAVEAVTTPAAGAVKAAPNTAEEAEQAKRYEEFLTTEAAKGQERLDAISQQLRSLDKDIESRVDRIVKLLSTIKDSTDSKGRVRQSKEKAIQGLKNSIAFYARERDKRDQAVVAPDANVIVSKDALAKDADVLDTRIEKRIGQITTLANSLTQSSEFSRYERYRDSEHDYSNESKQLARDVGTTAKVKSDLVHDLKAGIEKQTREKTALQQMLTTVKDPKRQEQIKDEIAEKEEIITDRRQQIEDLLMSDGKPTKAIGSKAAFEIDKLLAEMTVDLQRDFRKFQQLVAERNEAQLRAQANKNRLLRFQGSAAPAVDK
jgi:hypothetical protein